MPGVLSAVHLVLSNSGFLNSGHPKIRTEHNVVWFCCSQIIPKITEIVLFGVFHCDVYSQSCRKRRVYIDGLKASSLYSRVLIYTYASGNHNGSLHFLWKVPEEASADELISRNAEVIRRLQPSLPVYHTRAMKKQFYHDMQLFRCGNPSVLREIYRRLTGKCVCVCE